MTGLGFTMPDAIALMGLAAVILGGLCTVIAAIVAAIVAMIKFIAPRGLRNGNSEKLRILMAEMEKMREFKHDTNNRLQYQDGFIEGMKSKGEESE